VEELLVVELPVVVLQVVEVVACYIMYMSTSKIVYIHFYMNMYTYQNSPLYALHLFYIGGCGGGGCGG